MPSDVSRVITFRLHRELINRLDESAELLGITRNELVETLLAESEDCPELVRIAAGTRIGDYSRRGR